MMRTLAAKIFMGMKIMVDLHEPIYHTTPVYHEAPVHHPAPVAVGHLCMCL